MVDNRRLFVLPILFWLRFGGVFRWAFADFPIMLLLIVRWLGQGLEVLWVALNGCVGLMKVWLDKGGQW